MKPEITLEQMVNNNQMLVKSGGVILFSCGKQANIENITLAVEFYNMNPRILTRTRQARMIADYKGDFYKDSVKKKIFPRITQLGYDAYEELAKLFMEKYNKVIAIPKEREPIHLKKEYYAPKNSSRKTTSQFS